MDYKERIKKELYFELFELYKNRLKSKHLTYEAFIFERESGSALEKAAEEIIDRVWDVTGYFPFAVYHPYRTINAPMYIDRIVEQWFVEKYIQPVFLPQLYEYNMACQKNKGPFLTMDYVKAALEELYYMYGANFCIYQYDMQGYFDNFSHETAELIMQEIGEEAFWMYENIVKSFSVPDAYAAQEDDNKAHVYGFPKGNLPSQWTGIIYLDELDHEIAEDPACEFSIRYMDDGIAFYHHIEDCRLCDEKVREFLKVNDMGIRLHPKKTYYAPISRGFTFCGWRYSIDADTGKIHVRIKNTKKKEMEHRLKIISEEVRTGKMSVYQANTIRDGMFEYLSHGTESGRLIRYMKRQYPFPTK